MIIVEATNFNLNGDASKETKCDLLVNPANLIQSMAESWRMSIAVPYDAVIKAGYWTKYSDNQRVRLATRDEIVQYNALITTMGIGMYLAGEI